MIKLHTDGGCHNQTNSGFLRKLGGWAYLVIDGSRTFHAYGTSISTSNHAMELMAVIQGLRAIKSSAHIQVMVNSEYVVNGVNLWLPMWKNNAWKTSNNEAIEQQQGWQELHREMAFHSEVPLQRASLVAGDAAAPFVDRLRQLAITEVISGA